MDKLEILREIGWSESLIKAISSSAPMPKPSDHFRSTSGGAIHVETSQVHYDAARSSAVILATDT